MSPFLHNKISEVNISDLHHIRQEAISSPLRRARLCLHKTHDDPIQEMIIVFCYGSYVRPHRHVSKSESHHFIEGEATIVIFDDHGGVVKRIDMGASGTGKPFLYRLSSDAWHMLIPGSGFVIVHETVTGPFVKSEQEYAPWSPPDHDREGIRRFLTGLDSSVHRAK